MRAQFYDSFGDKNDIQSNTYIVPLGERRSVILRGWTLTRSYHLGFVRNTGGEASATVPGLTAGRRYRYEIYQYSDDTAYANTNTFRVNNGPAISTTAGRGSYPSFRGFAKANGEGQD